MLLKKMYSYGYKPQSGLNVSTMTTYRNIRRKGARSARKAGKYARRRLTYATKGMRYSKKRPSLAVKKSNNMAPKFTMYNSLISHKLRTKLTYVDTKTVSPGTTSIHHTFRLDSIFDPDFTGVGHQPAFHDQWANLYSKYRVIGASWHIKFQRGSDENVEHVLLGGTNAGEAVAYNVAARTRRNIVSTELVSGDDIATTLWTQAADLNFLREMGRRPGVQWKMRTWNKDVVLSGSTTMRQLYDDPSTADSPTDFGFNPAIPAQGRLVVGVLSTDGAAAQTITFDIKLVYDIELSEPIEVSGS